MEKILLAGKKIGSNTSGDFETCFKKDLFDGFRERVLIVLEIEVDEEALYKLTYSGNWKEVIGNILDKYLEIENDTYSRVGGILNMSKIAIDIINQNAKIDSSLLPKDNIRLAA